MTQSRVRAQIELQAVLSLLCCVNCACHRHFHQTQDASTPPSPAGCNNSYLYSGSPPRDGNNSAFLLDYGAAQHQSPP
ncbi:hypothetical protein BaRGS_00027974 [Batillaria attramentaria]|uniref:Secreted protein n=1 Tax=Batillaria attramentaria TaxID=370345 RepID=A0ABD0K1T5_9CAEN